MRITVVGAGRMGKILAAAMAVGNEVALYDADRDRAARLAGSLKLKALATMTETAAELERILRREGWLDGNDPGKSGR